MTKHGPDGATLVDAFTEAVTDYISTMSVYARGEEVGPQERAYTETIVAAIMLWLGTRAEATGTEIELITLLEASLEGDTEPAVVSAYR